MGIKKLSDWSPRRPFPVYEIENLSDLVRFVRNHTEEGETYIYRGQTKNWPIQPSISRVVVEEGQLLEIETRMLSEFSRIAVSHDGNFPDNPWEILAVAQHHGIPTRLVDWSYNALVAAWFAVEKPAAKNREYGVIWMYTPEVDDLISPEDRDTSPFELNQMRVFEPRHVNSRIREQDGLFTISPHHVKGGFRPLERYGDHRWCMRKIQIPATSFVGLRYDLNSVGVHAGKLFPGLDGLAREIRDSNCYKSDEAD